MLAKQYGIREHELRGPCARASCPFTAQTRMSGVDVNGTRLRKGAGDAILRWVAEEGGQAPPELAGPSSTGSGARAGPRSPSPATARCSASSYSKDVVKEGMRERFERCARWASAP